MWFVAVVENALKQTTRQVELLAQWANLVKSSDKANKIFTKSCEDRDHQQDRNQFLSCGGDCILHCIAKGGGTIPARASETQGIHEGPENPELLSMIQ